MIHLLFALPAAPLWILPLATAFAPDTLVTRDGRVLEVKEAREEGEFYRLVFEAGEIVCPKEQVVSVEMVEGLSDYEPKDEREREFLEKGYVRYKGKWLSKERYAMLLADEAEARRERTAELARHADFANAWERESKHFIVRSNTSPELLEHYTEMLEAFYSLMDDRVGINPTPSMRRKKFAVSIYKSHAELSERYGEGESGDDVLGFFDPADQTLHFYHDYKNPELSQTTGLHECTHLLTYLIDQDFWSQIWIEEAIADYYGTATIVYGPKGIEEIVPGAVQIDLVFTMQNAIEKGEHTPLADLFLVDDDDFDAFQYANAWAFVYFLQETPAYARNFERFFKELFTLKLKGYRAETINMGFDDKTGTRKRYSAEDVRDALLKRLKIKDLAALEREWIDFVAALPIDGAEARFRRAYNDVFYEGGSTENAMADLEHAIAAGYETGECYWTRGVAHIQLGDWDKGAADIRRAVELEPLDPNYRSELAWALSGWFGDDEDDELVGSPAELEEAELHYGLAAALDPDAPERALLYEKFLALRYPE